MAKFKTITAETSEAERLAILWAQYNSRTGRASVAQVDRIVYQFRNQTETLARMLAERGIR